MRASVRLLTASEEMELVLRWRSQRDERARDKLVLSHMPLVRKIAKRYAKFIPVEDGVQHGVIGLLRAVDKYDPEKGTRIATPAVWWIRAEIAAAMFQQSTVKQSQSMKQRSAFFRGERQVRMTSLDAKVSGPAHGRDKTLADILPSEEPTPEETAEQAIDGVRWSRILRSALKTLGARELEVIRNRWLCENPPTLEALGGVHGVSKERVRQIEVKALGKLREMMVPA